MRQQVKWILVIILEQIFSLITIFCSSKEWKIRVFRLFGLFLKKEESIKNNTYCPRLWYEIYIDDSGNVFSCCCKPNLLGSIYNEKLEDICNDKIIQFSKLPS